MTTHPPVIIRPTEVRDFPGITALCRAVYPTSQPWAPDQLGSHLQVFPQGQLVAVTGAEEQVVGMAASLIIMWDDYEELHAWRDFTDRGYFRNHDPAGRTLYGAEVMVHPAMQRRRIGKRLYEARRDIARTHRLARIRAGARLRGYHKYAGRLTPHEYVLGILNGRIKGPTLSFQLREGFEVFDVVGNYITNDPESLGYAALIEWLNRAVATPADVALRDPKWRVGPVRPRATPARRPQDRRIRSDRPS
ncbi:MAG TPA: GNAT family N-acetyltransferase [Gemmatimonadales bacterium]